MNAGLSSWNRRALLALVSYVGLSVVSAVAVAVSVWVA
jgi:apolipoprotein N-acyltransferase